MNNFNQYEPNLFYNLDISNYTSIVNFLLLEAPNYVEDIVNNYLDLFLIKYEDFVNKYNLLKKKYGNQFLDNDFSLLEQFHYI